MRWGLPSAQGLTFPSSSLGSGSISGYTTQQECPQRVTSLPGDHVTVGALGHQRWTETCCLLAFVCRWGVRWAEDGEQAHSACPSTSEIPLWHVRGAASGQAEGGQRRAGCGGGGTGPGRELGGRPPPSSLQFLPAGQPLQPAQGSGSRLRASHRGKQWAVEALS